jgi:hypothetical protein
VTWDATLRSRIGLAFVIGLIIAYGLHQLIAGGFFAPWMRLPALATTSGSLVSVGGGQIRLQLTSQVYLICEYPYDACWQQANADALPAYTAGAGRIEPGRCEPLSGALFPLRFPPANIRECVAGRTWYADGYIDAVVVRTADNVVWLWDTASTPYDFAPLALYCIIPIVTMVVTYNAIALRLIRRAQANRAQ